MAYQRIPLTTDPNQKFNCTLEIDGQNKTLSFFLAYNRIAEYWTMDITDTSSDEVLLTSIPLVPGSYPAENVLGQYAYLGIGSAYIVNAGNASTAYPDDSNLGTEWLLLWGDTPT